MDAAPRPRTALEAYAALAREKQRRREELAAAPKDRFGRIIVDAAPSNVAPERRLRVLLPEIDASGSEDDDESPRDSAM